MPQASVVLPVYNQADHIGAVLESHLQALSRVSLTFELLPVVNGPRRDDSLAVCEALSARDDRVRTLCIDQGGWGRAVRHGLSQARGDLLCYTNSARTAPEDLTLCLLYGVAHPGTVIKANRKIRDSVLRRLGSLLYNLECRSLFDLPVWDVNGTPKVFHRNMDNLLALDREDDLIDLQFVAICRRENYPVLEVPILSATRHGGESTTKLGSAWRMYSGAWRMAKTFEGIKR